MNIKNKLNFIKKHVEHTHNEQDMKYLLTFSDEEINEIYHQIIEYIL